MMSTGLPALTSHLLLDEVEQLIQLLPICHFWQVAVPLTSAEAMKEATKVWQMHHPLRF
jgi:hypothetical protein